MNESNSSVEILMKEKWSNQFLAECRFWIPNVLAPIVFIIGLVGNVTTIIVLTRKRMTGSTNIYLTALAAVDLVFLLLYMTIVFEHNKELNSPDKLFYWEYRRYALWVHDAASCSSTWLTVSFTLERYIAVCHPLKGKVLCTESRAKKVILFIVIFCLLSTITTPFETYVDHQRLEDAHDAKKNMVDFIEYSDLGKNTTYQAIFYWFHDIFFVLIPLILLGVLNFLLINAVRLSQIKREKMTQRASRKIYKERQENKITLALVAVVFLFLVCQAPTAITLIISLFYKPTPETDPYGYNITRAVGNICNFLVALYTACNFLLYCAMSNKYRQTMYRTFCPSFAHKHQRANTYSSNASCRSRSSMH